MNDTSPAPKPNIQNTSHNVMAEMLLIGNIMHNIALINEYAGTLSVLDFSDAATRYFYTVLENYYAVYGDEEIDGGHISVVILKLLEEKGIKMPAGITKKNCVKHFLDIKSYGSLQPADSEAYRSVKRASMLRQLENAKIDVQDILEREDFAELTADKVIGLIYEKIDPLASCAWLQRLG